MPDSDDEDVEAADFMSAPEIRDFLEEAEEEKVFVLQKLTFHKNVHFFSLKTR